MKRCFAQVLCILLMAVIIVGCAVVQRTGYLSDYEQLKNGDHLEKIWVSQEFRNKKQSIFIQKPDVQKIAYNRDASLASDYLYQSLLENLAEVGIECYRAKEKIPGGNYLVLETAITRWRKGNRALRVLISGISGSSIVQVEGRIIDPQTNKILLAFADSRAGSGYAGLDLTGGNSRSMMQDDMRGIARALAATLATRQT